jgi:hypothetical protein
MANQLKNETRPIREIVQEFLSGRILVPEFQRDYVWKPSQAPKLIDSLYRNFPISSLLIWECLDHVEARNKPTANRDFLGWLIDGQQRITTLARTLTADQDIDVVFNLETEQFSRPNAATSKDTRWIRVSDAWNEDWFRRFRRDLNDSPKDRRTESRVERLRSVLDYEIPIVRMVGHSFKDAVDAFTRINSQGVRLKSEDLESAQVAAKHSGFVRQHLIPFVTDLHSRGFERIFASHLFRACAFIAHPDGRNRTPLHELQTGEVEKAWKLTQRAVNNSLDLAAAELGITDMSILWSGSLLVPAIALCGLQPTKRDDREIAAWIAVASLCRRFSRSTSSILEQDLKACRSADPVGSLLKNLKQKRATLSATAEDFNGSLADRSGLLTTFIACRQLGAMDFVTGRRISSNARIDRHHIFPRALFPLGADRQRADVLV